MRKLWKKLKSVSPVYFFGGLIISVAVGLMIVGLTALMLRNIKGDAVRRAIMIPAYVLGFVTFVLLMRHYLSNKFKSLKNYYLMASVISFTAAFLTIEITSKIINSFTVSIESDNPSTKEILFAVAVIIAILTAGICVFILLFGLITRNKSKYISYICQEVERLSEDSESVVIEEEGGDELEKISASINKMSRELNEKRQRERELERQRTELITNVSHDLRSPLTSIIGYVRLLKENGCSDEKKFNEYIEVTDRRLEGLNKLVNELFELTKLDVPDLTLNYEQCDVTGFVKQFGFEIEQILRQKGLDLECSIDNTPYVMRIDIERMVRVLQNLFSNVIKYAESDSKVRLETCVGSNSIEIRVSNKVSGNSSINTDSMFDRFYKEDRARSDTSGAGLGLAIAKRIVELHGGVIHAAEKDRVLTVTVRLYGSKENDL